MIKLLYTTQKSLSNGKCKQHKNVEDISSITSRLSTHKKHLVFGFSVRQKNNVKHVSSQMFSFYYWILHSSSLQRWYKKLYSKHSVFLFPFQDLNKKSRLMHKCYSLTLFCRAKVYTHKKSSFKKHKHKPYPSIHKKIVIYIQAVSCMGDRTTLHRVVV